MRSIPTFIVFVALIAVVPPAVLSAGAAREAQSRFATFLGTVTDSNGQPVPGATIRATHTGNGLHREATTTADGTYSMVNIQPGTYDFRISLGETTMFARRGIVVRAGDIARVDSQLKTAVGSGVGRLGAPSRADTRQIQVSLHTHLQDGRLDAIAAIGGADEFDAYITADAGLCALRSGREPTDGVPAVGWQVAGRVLRRTSESITVRITWQRLWENGVRQSNPRTGSLEAEIRPGERFPLDSVTSGGGACSVAGGTLEATVIARPPNAPGQARSGSPTVSGAAGSARGAAVSERASAAAEELRQRGTSQYQDLVRLAPTALQVELWLVQTRPDNSQQVQLMTQPFSGSTSFVFPAVRLASEAGSVDVEVFGFLRHSDGDDGAGALNLQIAIGRNLRQQGARAVERYSASGQTVPWPAPTEVLSFELPVSPAEQRLLAGHRFDLRLRLRPR